MLVFLTNLSLIEFQVRYLTLFLIFSVRDDVGWFWMESLPKNIQLMLEFLKALFLFLLFSCYALMTFLMMMSVILLSMLMILLSILTWSVIWQNWLLNFNLIYQTLWTEAGSGLLISMLKKLNSFDQCNNAGAVDVKMDESVRKNHLLRYWVWLCLLNSGMAFILSLNFKCLQGS